MNSSVNARIQSGIKRSRTQSEYKMSSGEKEVGISVVCIQLTLVYPISRKKYKLSPTNVILIREIFS